MTMMKHMRAGVMAGGLLVSLGVVFAGAQTAPPGPVETLAAAKAVFERACGVCHPLERPLSKTNDRAGWEQIVERMRAKGAKLGDGEGEMVVTYLLTKNTFETKCSLCHGVDRPLGANKSAAGWLSTVQRMANKKFGSFTESEVASIAAYLSLVRPEKQ